MFKKLMLLSSILILSACNSIPENIQPVNNFDIKKYTGQWYEIARLDHSFERGLSQVTAEYELRDDGGIDVTNKGFLKSENTWKEAKGKAYFIDYKTVGHLKVSFFWPIYSSYIVFELGEEYDYAFVSGYKKDYLWFLSRTPTVSDELKQDFIEQIKAKGFDDSELIWLD